MLHLQSSTKEIETYIERISLLINNDNENNKINKILELKSLVQDPDISMMISCDLKDKNWIEETKTLIDTCIKRTTKSISLNNHVMECKNFSIFRQFEEKLFSNQSIKISKSEQWEFILVKENGNEIPWNQPKLIKNFNCSSIPNIISPLIKENNIFILTKEWLYKNQTSFFSKNIFLPIKLENLS